MEPEDQEIAVSIDERRQGAAWQDGRQSNIVGTCVVSWPRWLLSDSTCIVTR